MHFFDQKSQGDPLSNTPVYWQGYNLNLCLCLSLEVLAASPAQEFGAGTGGGLLSSGL